MEGIEIVTSTQPSFHSPPEEAWGYQGHHERTGSGFLIPQPPILPTNACRHHFFLVLESISQCKYERGVQHILLYPFAQLTLQLARGFQEACLCEHGLSLDIGWLPSKHSLTTLILLLTGSQRCLMQKANQGELCLVRKIFQDRFINIPQSANLESGLVLYNLNWPNFCLQ